MEIIDSVEILPPHMVIEWTQDPVYMGWTQWTLSEFLFHRRGLLVRVQLRPQFEPLDDSEGFLASLRFEHRSKLDKLGIEIDSFDEKSADFGSSPISRKYQISI
jgi:hypothetical protein